MATKKKKEHTGTGTRNDPWTKSSHAGNKYYQGDDAVDKLEDDLGRTLTAEEKRIVALEGYVDGFYYDSKNVLTRGVGQTGKYAEGPYAHSKFNSAFKEHVKRAEKHIPNLNTYSPEARAEIIQAEYRGDLGQGKKFRQKLNAADKVYADPNMLSPYTNYSYKDAATEFLDNKDYRDAKKSGSGVANRMEAVANAVRERGNQNAKVSRVPSHLTGLPVALPQDVVNQGPTGVQRLFQEKQMVGPYGYKKGGSVNFEDYMKAVENSNKDLIPISNFYANQNVTLPKDGTYILPPEQIITPYQDDTIVEEEIITQSPQYSMQEAARRSMMQGNEEERMADYDYARDYAEDYPYLYPRRARSVTRPPMQAAQRMMGGFAQGGVVDKAQGLASLGRGGDSTLVHMQPREVAGLQQLAQANGTSLTRNPMTGMPEAFSLGGMFKAALPIAAGYFAGPTGFAMMGPGAGSAITAGALTGAGVAAATGDDPIMGAVSGGMGGYSGMGLESAVANMPAAAPSTVGNAVPYANLPTPVAAETAANLKNLGSLTESIPQSQGNFLERFGTGLSKSTATPKTIQSINPDTGNKIVGQFEEVAGEYNPGSFFDKAKVIGSPIASMGLGGLEASDFMVKPDFNDPRDKYDPRSRLDLNRDTGINEALSRDTGLRLLAKGGYLKGPGDGMSDDIPATINGEQPAALADGEFVVPADVVSHLGNGSSEAGSKQLYAMMDRIRKARTGKKSQGKEIKPGKYMPR
jgi:hypothetical protein